MSKIAAAPTMPRAPREVPRSLLNGGGWRSKRSKVASQNRLCKRKAPDSFHIPCKNLGRGEDPGYGVERIATWQPWGMISKNSRMSVSRIRMHPWEAIRPMLSASGVP